MSETITREFRLGDLVTSKKTGLPVIGKVIGLMYADYYNAVFKPNKDRWTVLYPDWLEKKIVWVLFQEPQKATSQEEYFKGWREECAITRQESDIIYKWMTPVSQSATYPEDDLELVEE